MKIDKESAYVCVCARARARVLACGIPAGYKITRVSERARNFHAVHKMHW